MFYSYIILFYLFLIFYLLYFYLFYFYLFLNLFQCELQHVLESVEHRELGRCFISYIILFYLFLIFYLLYFYLFYFYLFFNLFQCELQHVLECVEHRELGRCSRPSCPLPHPKHRQKKPKAPQRKALPKRRRSRRLSAVLGDDSQKKAFSQSKQSVPNRYFDNKEKEKSISHERREPEKKLLLLGEKRERIMKLINGMKERNKGSSSTRNYVPTTAGKNNIVDDSVFVEPLPQYLGSDLSLPNFIPLDSTFKSL